MARRPVTGFRSIRTKLTLIVTGAFVALLVVVSGIEMYRVQASLGRVLGGQQLTLVSRVADEIDDKLRSTHGALIALSKAIPPEIAQDPERLRSNLQSRPGIRSLVDGLFVFSTEGTVIVEVPAIGALGVSAADREYFQDTPKGRRGVISRPYIGRVKTEPAIMLTAPVLADNTPALISYVDGDERYRYANATYSDWFGEQAAGIPGKSVREVVGEADYAVRAPYIRQALAGNETTFESPLTVGGVLRHVHVRYVPDLRDDGTVAGVYILANDVSELKRTEQMLRESQWQLSLALEGSQLALFDWNIVTGDVFLNDHWAVMMGRRAEPTRTTFTALEERVHADERAVVGRSIRDVLKGLTSHYRVEHRVRTDDGRWIWIQSHGQVTERDEAGRALRLLGTNADITERKRNEQELAESRMELERAVLVDSLTGLSNRRELDERIRQSLARAQRSGHTVAILCLDIDLFKSINDTLGHAAGDAVLKEFAARLSRSVRASDTAARLGGDEFVVLLENLHRAEDAHAVAGKIIDAMREAFHIDSHSVRVSTSIGVAFTTAGGESGEEVLRRADGALYEAKRAGRNRFHVAGAPTETAIPADRTQDADRLSMPGNRA